MNAFTIHSFKNLYSAPSR